MMLGVSWVVLLFWASSVGLKSSGMALFKHLMVGRLVVLGRRRLGLVISASNDLSFSSKLAQAS